MPPTPPEPHIVVPTIRRQPVAFNVLERTDPDLCAVAADAVVAAFRGIWAESWGPRMEHILRHALMALIERSEASLVLLPRLAADESRAIIYL